MSHPRTEETRFNEGESASGRGGFSVSGFCFGLVGFCLFLGRLCSFPPHHVVFPSLSMMIWALRPHGVRARGKKFLLSLMNQGSPGVYRTVPCMGRMNRYAAATSTSLAPFLFFPVALAQALAQVFGSNPSNRWAGGSRFLSLKERRLLA